MATEKALRRADFYEAGYSSYEIGKMENVSHQAILISLKQAGMQRRSLHARPFSCNGCNAGLTAGQAIPTEYGEILCPTCFSKEAY